VRWSHWLADNIPGTRRRVELQGARIFFPEERWQEFNKEYAHTGSWHDKRGDENGRSDAESRAIPGIASSGKPLVLFNIWDAAAQRPSPRVVQGHRDE